MVSVAKEPAQIGQGRRSDGCGIAGSGTALVEFRCLFYAEEI